MPIPFARFVREIMTREVVSLREDDSLESADRKMKSRCFRHLPVVDDGKLVGLLSERDLLRASISAFDENFEIRDICVKRYFFVHEVMTRAVVTAHPDMLLSEAARLLLEKKIGCLPVTNDAGELVGILTRGDFMGLVHGLLRDREYEDVERKEGAVSVRRGLRSSRSPRH